MFLKPSLQNRKCVPYRISKGFHLWLSSEQDGVLLEIHNRKEESCVWSLVKVKYPSTVGCWLQPLGTDMVDSLQLQTAGETYTPYQRKAPPLQAEEEGPPT
jgi:hypothetical protein